MTNKEIGRVQRYRVGYGRLRGNPLRSKDAGEEKYGRRRYADLIGEGREGDLGEMIYLVDKNKETCYKSEKEELYTM